MKCENVFLSAKETSNFPITIVRPSQTYSKDKIPLSVKGKSCWSVISRIKRDLPVIIHGDGTSAWVSTHSDDFSTGFVKLIGNEKCYGEDFDITSDEIYNWNIIYEFLGEALNKKVKTIHIPTDILTLSKKYDYKMSIEGDKQYSVIFNNKKLKEVAPDFKCNISIKEGILKYLDYMENNPNLQKEEPDFDEWCEKIIEKYNMTQTDALMMMQILELKIQNKKLGDLGCYIENISGRLNELKSNLEYIDDDLNDINSRMDDIQSEIGNLKE